MIDSASTLFGQPGAASFDTASLGLGDYYRALYSQVRNALRIAEPDSATVGVTSCVSGEGVSTVCQSVAIAAANQLRRPVLLLDAKESSRAPVGATAQAAGLFDILAGTAQPADCVRPGTARDVFVLSAGTPRAGNGCHFPAESFIELLAFLKKEFAFVLVDLPPCNELTSCLRIAGLLDGVLLVVEAERVRSQVVAHSRDHLFQAGARLIGVVLNKRRNHVPEWLYRRL
ncbi:MAG: CpsD/CapB family tyrosine-protein kinase [Planctomycetes bacterium]|nr:CpsD/CapB family tyrosine-protein kinase [Planctomycetota bacterium]